MVVETVDAIISGNITPIDQASIQTDEPLRPAPKIFKETCHIDWKKTSEQIHNLVRGLSPYPAAWCEWISPDNNRFGIKIYRTTPLPSKHNYAPGSIHTDGKNHIDIACTDGFIRIEELQLAGNGCTRFITGFSSQRRISLRIKSRLLPTYRNSMHNMSDKRNNFTGRK